MSGDSDSVPPLRAIVGPDTAIGQVDDIASRPPVGDHPLTLTLHSGEIIATTLGRPEHGRKHAILGWSRAASHYIRLLKAHFSDNPFADMVLILAERDLSTRREKLRYAAAGLDAQRTDGLDVGLWSSRQPLHVALDTGNAHARALGGYIFEVDRLVRRLKASVATGDKTMAEIGQEVRGYQRSLRQAIQLPVYWNSHLRPITREEVRAGRHRDLATLQKRFGGRPNEDVMSHRLQPQNVPLQSLTEASHPVAASGVKSAGADPGAGSGQFGQNRIEPDNSVDSTGGRVTARRVANGRARNTLVDN